MIEIVIRKNTNWCWGHTVIEVYQDKKLIDKSRGGEYWLNENGSVALYGSTGGTGYGFSIDKQDIRFSYSSLHAKITTVECWSDNIDYFKEPYYEQEKVVDIDTDPLKFNFYLVAGGMNGWEVLRSQQPLHVCEHFSREISDKSWYIFVANNGNHLIHDYCSVYPNSMARQINLQAWEFMRNHLKTLS